MPQAVWLINNRHLFLTALKGLKSKVRVPAWWVKALSQITDFLLYFHVVKEARKRCGISFIKALTSFTRAPLSGSNHIPKVSPAKTWGGGVDIPTHELGEDTDIQSRALCSVAAAGFPYCCLVSSLVS